MKLLVFLSRNRVEREVTDVKTGAVCSKSGVNSCSDARAKITADSGCADEHDIRLKLIDNTCKSMCIRLGSVILQFRIIDDNDLISAIFAKRICKALDAGAEQNSGNFRTKVCSKLLALADELQSNSGELSVDLLGEYIYALVLFLIFCCHFNLQCRAGGLTLLIVRIQSNDPFLLMKCSFYALFLPGSPARLSRLRFSKPVLETGLS